MRVEFGEALRDWFKIGCLGFGGEDGERLVEPGHLENDADRLLDGT